ncbi:LysR family transcriptional regulator [Pelagibius litoralis]|uniref:LysR family transcriptional regulator n=1 Tax=Pelagibius litoralis TaxID=374515 RepID=A0A967F0V2_9PROT|nr:LysR family transcriptional regulator [Pelagibius litoralis]NIA70958.1 LysR family transcriptional regulator [Pelagibius litoralis]
MDLTLLRSFTSVADTGSFSGAANKLNLTQSTVSHQIARLEGHIGRRLFERTTRRCDLTATGRTLLEQARDVVNRFDEMERQYRPDTLRGELRVGVPDDYHLFNPIAHAISDFSREQPLVTLEVRAGLADNLLESLRAGDLDLVLVREILGDEPAGTLIVEDLVWIGKEAAISDDSSGLTLALISEPCVYRRTVLRTLSDAGISHRVVVSSDSLAAVLAFVGAGFAVSAVIRGSIPSEMKILAANRHLPALPKAALVPYYANDRPTVLSTALLQRIEETIRHEG